MPKLQKILIAAALLLTASGLYAQDSRFSIGLGVGRSTTDPDSAKAVANGAVTVVEDSGDFSWSAQLNYKLNDRWKVHIQYNDAGDSQVGGTVGSGFNYNIRYWSSLWNVGATFNVPFNDRLSLDLSAGPAYQRIIADARGFASNKGFSKEDFGVYGQVGLKVTFTPAVSLHADFAYYAGDFTHQIITVGIRIGL